MNLNIFSDLRKPGLVLGESLSPSTNINSVLEKSKIYTEIMIFTALENMYPLHNFDFL